MRIESMSGSWVVGALFVLAGLPACVAGVDEEGLSDEEAYSARESVATVSQAVVDNRFAVGVIPIGNGAAEGGLYGTTCPADSSLVTIYMDDEDDSNRTAWGWSWRLPQDSDPDFTYHIARWPAPQVGFNTRMRFCKVNGQSFRPMTTDVNDKARFYALLKLGQTCPNGSAEFSRYFDNEDDGNENSAAGPIAPNVSNVNTSLKFCFFRTGSSPMSDFPNLGVPYAVFHDFEGGQPFPYDLALGKAKHSSDDEDDSNENSLSPSGTSSYFDFRAIIADGRNTTFDLARVW